MVDVREKINGNKSILISIKRGLKGHIDWLPINYEE
jgi:hypothetical protein